MAVPWRPVSHTWSLPPAPLGQEPRGPALSALGLNLGTLLKSGALCLLFQKSAACACLQRDVTGLSGQPGAAPPAVRPCQALALRWGLLWGPADPPHPGVAEGLCLGCPRPTSGSQTSSKKAPVPARGVGAQPPRLSSPLPWPPVSIQILPRPEVCEYPPVPRGHPLPILCLSSTLPVLHASTSSV